MPGVTEPTSDMRAQRLRALRARAAGLSDAQLADEINRTEAALQRSHKTERFGGHYRDEDQENPVLYHRADVLRVEHNRRTVGTTLRKAYSRLKGKREVPSTTKEGLPIVKKR